MAMPLLSDTDLLNRPLHLLNGSVPRNRLAKAAMSETLGIHQDGARGRMVVNVNA